MAFRIYSHFDLFHHPKYSNTDPPAYLIIILLKKIYEGNMFGSPGLKIVKFISIF